MKYATEIGSGAMIYITKFHDDRFSHPKLIGGDTYKHRHRVTYPTWRSHKTAFNFSKYRRKLAKNCPVHWWKIGVVQVISYTIAVKWSYARVWFHMSS
jgi:hypothetical protein